MDWRRTFNHLTATRRLVRRHFPAAALDRIEAAIRDSEHSHMGELRFAVEASLDWPELLSGLSSHQRALQVFSDLRVWDTEQNSGVLIYLLLADRKVEIVADRGIHARVGTAGWQAICTGMEEAFKSGDFEEGILDGLAKVTTLLRLHFPAQVDNSNELPDAPVIL